MALFSLNDRVVAITGAGSGIGKAIASIFAKQGAVINVLDLKEPAEPEGKFYQVNVSVQSEVDNIVADIIKTHGRIDILVNSSGIAQIANLENTSDSDIDKIYQVNIKGTYNTMHAVVPFMKKQKKGVI